MNPITLATLAYGAYKMFKNRKPQVTRAGQTQNYAGAYPDATRRDSTERDDSNRPDPYTPPPPSDSAETPSLTARQQRGQLGWSQTGAMEGFRVGYGYEGDEKARNSVKNTFGRIASRYEAKPSSIDAIINDPDFKKFFPNAKKVGFDKIDFGGVMSDFETGTPVGVVDVGAGFDPESDTGRGWWWGYEDGGSTSTGAKSGASGGVKFPTTDMPGFPKEPGAQTPQTFTSKVPGVSVLTPEEIWSVPERPSPFASGSTLGSMTRRYR